MEKAEIKRFFRLFAKFDLFFCYKVYLGDLGKTSYTSMENLFRRRYTVWHSSTRMSVTQLSKLFSGKSSF